jgi:hypothetical protein
LGRGLDEGRLAAWIVISRENSRRIFGWQPESGEEIDIIQTLKPKTRPA